MNDINFYSKQGSAAYSVIRLEEGVQKLLYLLSFSNSSFCLLSAHSPRAAHRFYCGNTSKAVLTIAGKNEHKIKADNEFDSAIMLASSSFENIQQMIKTSKLNYTYFIFFYKKPIYNKLRMRKSET